MFAQGYSASHEGTGILIQDCGSKATRSSVCLVPFQNPQLLSKLLCLFLAPISSLSNSVRESWEGLLICLRRKGGFPEATLHNHFPLSSVSLTVAISLKKKKKKKPWFLFQSR